MPLITNIQKFSIHDGDGVRTTVFFKGCGMRCQWCHNPETQIFTAEMMLDRDKCTGCAVCEHICPNGAVLMHENKPDTDMSKCSKCGKCEKFCTALAREVVGKEYTIKELMKELLKDRMFYEDSGGGVTFSGGEVMCMDSEYVLAAAKELKKEDVSLTIDTCGYAPYENFEKILPYVDTFLYDIKVADKDIHKKYTGVDNSLIFDNLRKLSASGARLYIRIPAIREVNGNEERMKEIIDFLKENDIRVEQINLLPYHDTGRGKYTKIGRVYEGEDLHTPLREEMDCFVQMFKAAGYINTKIGG